MKNKPKRLYLIKRILQQRCIPEGNWILSKYKKIWFSFKAIIAILINRWTNEDALDAHWVTGRFRDYYIDNPVSVCSFGGREVPDFEAGSISIWNELIISHKGIYIAIIENQYP